MASTATIESLQLGVIQQPAQLVRNGFPSDQGKRCTSAQILLRDPGSIQALQRIESDIEKHAPPGFTLNSSFIRTVDEGDITYPVVRCKFSRDPTSFSSGPVASGDVAQTMEELEYGHLIIGLFRPVAWKRDGKVGVVLYCNRLACFGKVENPLGAYVPEEVEWK